MSKVWIGEHTCFGDKMARHSSSDLESERVAFMTKEDRWKRELKVRREASLMLAKDAEDL
jgi:hypothetical protein